MLLTPGPTPVPEFARTAMAQETLHHRTPEFEAIFEKTRNNLLELLQMDEAIMLASTGTGAMEACVSNLTHSKALTINAGKFGQRFSKICRSLNIDFTEIAYEWDTPADIHEILKTIQNDSSIDSLCIQICESAGGLRHPVEKIAAQVKKFNPDIMIIADGITAVGVEPIDTSHIDALITGSQKALMLPPGLAMIGLSNTAVQKIQHKPSGFYFNLATEIQKQRQNTTAWTAATTLIIGLNKILEHIKQKGFVQLFQKTQVRAHATRAAIEALGLKIYPKTPANSMTAVYCESSDELRKVLKEDFGVNIAGGQDHLKGKIFRINHMGLVKDYEATWVINALELALDKIGQRQFDGLGGTTFLKEFTKEHR